MTTLALMLWGVFTALTIGGCVLSSYMGDWVFAIGIGVTLGITAGMIHFFLT